MHCMKYTRLYDTRFEAETSHTPPGLEVLGVLQRTTIVDTAFAA